MRWQNIETPTFAGSAGSAGEPAIVETMQLLDHDGNEVAAFTKAVDGTITNTVDGQPKVYRALLTQTGTNAPVATVTENTLGGDVVWTYNAEGTYIGTLADAFSTSTVVQCSGVIIYAGILYGFIGSEQIDSDSVQVMTFAPGNGPEESQGAVVYLPSNSLLINQPIQILVRP